MTRMLQILLSWNINVKVILVSITSRSNFLILRSVNICSILYSNCVSSHNYTWSVDNHTYIPRHMYMHAVIYKCLTVYNLNDVLTNGGSEFINSNMPTRTDLH